MTMKSFVKKVVALGLICGATQASAEVWKTENRWSQAYEQKFAEFIQNVDVNIFSGSGKWGGIPTDCADAAYALRIIFAYENRLPVAFRTWEGTQTNKISKFDSTEAGVKRVRKFIAYISSETSTKTMVDDTYPIAIRKGVLIPGVMFIHPPGSQNVPLTFRAGHALYVREVQRNGNIRYMDSTVPVAVRKLQVRNGIQFAPMGEDGGFRAWKWPDSDERPNLSYEQFQIGGWEPNYHKDAKVAINWQKAVTERIQVVRATAQEKRDAQLENLRSVVESRIAAVNRGWAYYNRKYNPGQCMNEDDYDDHSTPTRDVKVQREIENFIHAVKGSGNWKNELKKVTFEVLPGTYITGLDLYNVFFTEIALSISEPEHSPEVRWGLKAQGRWPCPHRAKEYRGGHLIQQ